MFCHHLFCGGRRELAGFPISDRASDFLGPERGFGSTRRLQKPLTPWPRMTKLPSVQHDELEPRCALVVELNVQVESSKHPIDANAK
jgi:hypothetical protein